MKKRKKVHVKRWIFGILVLAGIAMLVWQENKKNDPVLVNTVYPQIGDLQETVSSSGLVESENTKTYFAAATAKIGSIFIEPGDEVLKDTLMISYDQESAEKTLEQAKLQYEAGKSTYNSSLNKSKDAQNKLNEAQTNLPILEQQISDTKGTIKALTEELTNFKNDTANALRVEANGLQKELLELQKDPVGNQDRILTVQKALQDNQYVMQLIGTTGKEKDLNNQIEEQNQLLAGYQEAKSKMEAQKQQSEVQILSSQEKSGLSANNKLSALTLEAAEKSYEEGTKGVVADFTGIVTSLQALEGATVPEGTQLLSLSSSEEIKVTVKITKYDLPKIKMNQKAEVLINEKKYKGTIAKISRMATSTSTSNAGVTVEIHVENPDENIYLGLDAKAEIFTNSAKNALLIPIEALNADKTGDFVYVLENETVIRKEILTGISTTEFIEVKEGLNDTDLLVLSTITGNSVEEGMKAANIVKEEQTSTERESEEQTSTERESEEQTSTERESEEQE